MNGSMQTVYVFMWAALAVLTFILGFKHRKTFFMFTVFFVFMSVWYALKAFWNLPVFEGALRWVFTGVMLLYLAVAVLLWIRDRKRDRNTKRNDEDPND